jgi:hypothetical protein
MNRNSYREIELQVLRWGEDRRILPNSTPLAQAIKTTEEVAELLKALSRGDKDAAIDAYGDILTTMVLGAALLDVDLVECFAKAYETIAPRRGYLTADGIFVKQE